MSTHCPHGYRWGDGDEHMPKDRAADGCVYQADAATAIVRERAAVITKLNRQLHAALADRDTDRARVLLADIEKAAKLTSQADAASPPDQEPRPLHVLRTIAETTARLVVRTEPAIPELPPRALHLLAGCYIELRDQVRALHDLVDQTNPIDPIGSALTRVGLARRPHKPEPAVKLVPTPLTPTQVAALGPDQLVELYLRIMGRTLDFAKHETFVVRVWDGMDGCWTDCTGEVGRDAALRYWAEKTDGGAHHVAFAEIDYYRIFPGGTRMAWDGSEGREMLR